MSDLSDERLAVIINDEHGQETSLSGDRHSLAVEVQRHRAVKAERDAEFVALRKALWVRLDEVQKKNEEIRLLKEARAADAERVRSVVESAAAGILGPNGPVTGSWDVAARAIADGVAKQLPAMSAEDLATLRGMRESRYLSADEAALLDRLLTAPASKSADDERRDRRDQDDWHALWDGDARMPRDR